MEGKTWKTVSEACQINDLDHWRVASAWRVCVSEACQINDLDHARRVLDHIADVSEACQINDLDHQPNRQDLYH